MSNKLSKILFKNIERPYENLDKISGSFLGLVSAILFIFSGVSMFGTGLPFIIFVVLSFISITIIISSKFNIYFDIKVLEIFFLYFIFSVIYAVSFFLSSKDLNDLDMHYLISNMANIGWLVIFYIIVKHKSQFAEKYLSSFVTGISLILILSWFSLSFYYSDFFFLRKNIDSTYIEKITLFHNPNHLARELLVILCLLFSYYLSIKDWRTRYVMLLMAGLVLIIVSTLSRTNIISLFVFFIGVFYFYRLSNNKKKTHSSWFIIFVLIFTTMISLGIPEIRERIYSLYEMMLRMSDVDEPWLLPRRFRTWMASIQIIANNPFFGVGISNVNWYLAQYGSILYIPGASGFVIAIHGGFLKIAVYGGTISLMAFLIFYYRTYKITNYLSNKYDNQYHYPYMLKILLLILIVSNTTASSLEMPITWMAIGVLLANSFNPTVDYPYRA